jgi:hypothetical protein
MIEAIPTEYKSVVYRSKSEAMFARWLELKIENGQMTCAGFMYEPKMLQTKDGWIPDFLFWSIDGWIVAEYKPATPTKSYVSVWETRCSELRDRLSGYGLFMLYYGSVFSRERGKYNFYKGKAWFFDSDWISPHEEAIKATRFDLEAAK